VMFTRRFQARDWEVLRTLLRLRYVTTHELQAAFFGSETPARRRLRTLADYGLVMTHRKGVPERLPYTAWRLTTRGIETTLEGFPDEPVVDGLAERLGEGSLVHIEHREALASLYFAFVNARVGGRPGEPDRAALAEVVNAQRSRASQIFWQPDGDLVLRFSHLGEATQIQPDATVSGRHVRARVFVELDRSTRTLSRIAEALHRYATFLREGYAETFRDGRSPRLLYVVRSEGRKDGIASLTAEIVGDVARWAVATERDAVRWLERELVDPAREVDLPDAPGGGDGERELDRAARRVYAWARSYERALRAEGGALPPEGESRLLELHRALRERKLAHGG
jgi:hypothetical protein